MHSWCALTFSLFHYRAHQHNIYAPFTIVSTIPISDLTGGCSQSWRTDPWVTFWYTLVLTDPSLSMTEIVFSKACVFYPNAHFLLVLHLQFSHNHLPFCHPLDIINTVQVICRTLRVGLLEDGMGIVYIPLQPSRRGLEPATQSAPCTDYRLLARQRNQ